MKSVSKLSKIGDAMFQPFKITQNMFSYGLVNFIIMYQQNMIMYFVNTKITLKHGDAMIFFPHSQQIIYHFKDNNRSRMFFTKFLIPFFICQGSPKMHAYS